MLLNDEDTVRHNEEQADETQCLIVARAISEIVRFSMNEDFRKLSFKMLDVESSKEVGKKIYEKLQIATKNPEQLLHIDTSDDEHEIEKLLSEECTRSEVPHQEEENELLSTSDGYWLWHSFQRTTSNARPKSINSQNFDEQ